MTWCTYRELEFAERRCTDIEKDRLFPIRFLLLMEAHDQRMFGLTVLGRSRYHPEKPLDLWERVSIDTQYLEELEAEGFRFDLDEQAVKLALELVHIGDRFIEDFLEVETILGVELLFPDAQGEENSPAFREFKRYISDKKSRETRKND